MGNIWEIFGKSSGHIRGIFEKSSGNLETSLDNLRALRVILWISSGGVGKEPAAKRWVFPRKGEDKPCTQLREGSAELRRCSHSPGLGRRAYAAAPVACKSLRQHMRCLRTFPGCTCTSLCDYPSQQPRIVRARDISQCIFSLSLLSRCRFSQFTRCGPGRTRVPSIQITLAGFFVQCPRHTSPHGCARSRSTFRSVFFRRELCRMLRGHVRSQSSRVISMPANLAFCFSE